MLDSVGYVGIGVSTTWFFLKPHFIGIDKGFP